ncbi:peptidoglycan hydrolase-like protein with peptidoglycan-binding domain [Allocatelliglobosispora scoriae]|uniref:Peptidoglycan hydrolase-like protein with peptidoglycan-binding domain n=1 Tax=Allocatelliglobosispora scoriae TaxID=643052 RepID=A0A841BTA1_9ACTN|nr:hypothetical protein [Allocatelliglobosispora scoriae]MBB5869972.1 peptidoglycan hydrolase-like protein with peptidoglycan-binding domain [Allocatelliglobosispora scoriae]
MRPRARMIALGGGAAVLVAATVVAWIAATTARTPGQRAAQAAPPSRSMITAPVTSDRIVDQLLLDGVLARSATVVVPGPTAVEGATKLVITKVPVKAGDTVNAGKVLAVVSGRPVIALAGAFPAYRDIARGDRGPDVTQLQRGLRARYNTPITGVFDGRTESDLRKLYTAAGYQPVRRPVEASASTTPASPPPTTPTTRMVVPAGEIAFVPTLPAMVTSVPASVGATAGASLVVLASGAWQVHVTVDDATERALSALPPTTALRFGEGPLSQRGTRLVEVRDSPPPTGGTDGAAGPLGQAGQRVAIFEVGGSVGAPPGDPQQVVVEKAKSPDGALVVPVSALWTAADGTVTVTVVTNGGQRREVTVNVLVTVVGQVAVSPVGGALAAGDQVLVSATGGPRG